MIWYLYRLEVGEQQILVSLLCQHGFFLSIESTLCLPQHVFLFSHVFYPHLQS